MLKTPTYVQYIHRPAPYNNFPSFYFYLHVHTACRREQASMYGVEGKSSIIMNLVINVAPQINVSLEKKVKFS